MQQQDVHNPWGGAPGPRPDEVSTRPTPSVFGADVVRTIEVRPTAVGGRIREGVLWPEGAVLSLGRHGTLVIERPLVPAVWSGLAGWRTSGRLVGRGWGAHRLGGVDLEIFPASATAFQIRLARQSPFPSHWGARRVRRYWALAHAAADQLMLLVSPGLCR
jgi:hypothetical protein